MLGLVTTKQDHLSDSVVSCDEVQVQNQGVLFQESLPSSAVDFVNIYCLCPNVLFCS